VWICFCFGSSPSHGVLSSVALEEDDFYAANALDLRHVDRVRFDSASNVKFVHLDPDV